MARTTPDSVSLEINFAPVVATDLWARVATLLRGALERWWQGGLTWGHMFDNCPHTIDEMSVDHAFERAKRDMERIGDTLFGTMIGDVDTPAVQIGVTEVIEDDDYFGAPRCKRLSVIVRHSESGRGTYRAKFKLMHELFFDLLLSVLAITEIRSAFIDLSISMLPVPKLLPVLENQHPLQSNMLVFAEPKDSFLARFDDPTVLERVSFDEKLEVDDLLIIGRALEADDDIAMTEICLEDAFELARAAKPGSVVVDVPGPNWVEEEFALLERGERQLYFAGYHAGDKIAEYTCAITEPDVHLRPGEVIELAYCADMKQLPDGRPLDRVRVVFLDRDAAYRERRPLLDSNVEVYHLGNEGQLVPVTD